MKTGWKYLLLALGAFTGLGIETLYAFLNGERRWSTSRKLSIR